MGLTRREFALLLAMTPKVGGKTLTRVLARNDLLGRSPEAFLRLSAEAMREEYRVAAVAAEHLVRVARDPVSEIGPLQERLDKLGVTLVTMADAHYPERVEQLDPDPPGALFLYGNLKLLKSKTFCVLSSRNTMPIGLDCIETLAEEGVLQGEVLVSGHDTPEYQRSAVVPLRWGAPRILCLDRGLFQALGENLKDEPFRAARLWRFQFDATTDLVVSPFRPESPFVRNNNKVRDRLIASLSDRLDFVEVNEGGNMNKLATLALQCGRSVRISDRSTIYRRLEAQGPPC
jgi:predicted Rossmann fold nucleotide-binding protein DprA/Smf involved in DNA uptake